MHACRQALASTGYPCVRAMHACVRVCVQEGAQVGKIVGVQAPNLQTDILRLSDPNAAAAS